MGSHLIKTPIHRGCYKNGSRILGSLGGTLQCCVCGWVERRMEICLRFGKDL